MMTGGIVGGYSTLERGMSQARCIIAPGEIIVPKKIVRSTLYQMDHKAKKYHAKNTMTLKSFKKLKKK